MACSKLSRRFLLVALLAPLLALACAAEREPPPPAPEAVEPAVGFLTVDVPVLIRGRDFHLRASQGLDGATEDRVSAQFRAWLGPVELRDVTWVDQGTLAAVIPANLLAQGSHDLVVEGPYGTRGVLAPAYDALAAQPPDLFVDPVAIPSVVAVGAPVRIRVHVENRGPGPLDPFQLQLRRALEGGQGVGEPLQGAVVGEIPGSLGEGDSIDVEYLVTTAAASPGTFWYEVKGGGYSPLWNASIPSVKVPVSYLVVDAAPPP